MATVASVVMCNGSRKPGGPPPQHPSTSDIAPDATQAQKVAPILDDSAEYICFAATAEELARAAPGWLIPPPNRKVPLRTNEVNPFTNEPIVDIDYSAPNQPKPPAHSAELDYDAFPRVATDFVRMNSLTALFHAIGGGDPDDLLSQLLSQRLVSSGEHEVEVLAVPESLAARIAHLPVDQIDAIAERWRPIEDQFIDGGLVPVPQPALDERQKALRALVQLFSEAARAKRRVFLYIYDV